MRMAITRKADLVIFNFQLSIFNSFPLVAFDWKT